MTRNVLWSPASVCLSVCLSATACLHYYMDPNVTRVSGRGCPLVVHYWVNLQSVHGFRCNDNRSAECVMSASACTRSMPDSKRKQSCD